MFWIPITMVATLTGINHSWLLMYVVGSRRLVCWLSSGNVHPSSSSIGPNLVASILVCWPIMMYQYLKTNHIWNHPVRSLIMPIISNHPASWLCRASSSNHQWSFELPIDRSSQLPNSNDNPDKLVNIIVPTLANHPVTWLNPIIQLLVGPCQKRNLRWVKDWLVKSYPTNWFNPIQSSR